MRTAEEVLKEKIGPIRWSLDSEVSRATLIEAMNQFAKEALGEAAKTATVRHDKVTYNGVYSHHEATVDKQSIQKLIDNLK